MNRAAQFLAVGGLMALAACAPKRVELPSGPGVPAPDAAALYREATRTCRGIRTLTAELGLSGRTGRTKLRGRALAGFAAPASMRLEGVAPFGAPGFILATSPDRTVLLLPRDGRVLTGGDPAAIVEALTGVRLAPDALLAVLTGCVSARAEPGEGRAYGRDWIAVDLDDGGTAYLRRAGSAMQIAAGRIGDLTIEYDEVLNGLPRRVRVWSDARVPADLRVALSQVETNVALDDRVFEVQVPADARPMSLDELRAAGPLGAADPGGSR